MKVLWFTNTPSLASEELKDKNNIGGWIASLETEVAKVEDIELGVAFHFEVSVERNFTIGKTNYYALPFPILSKGHKRGIFSRWRHKIEPTSIISQYLEVINQFNPDIIHVFGTEQAYGLIIDKVKVPVVIQIQGNLSVYEKKWFSGVSNYNILRHSNIKTLVFAYGIWHLFFLFKKRAKRERELMKNCKNIIGRTDWDRRVTRILSPNSRYFHCDELLRTDFYTSKCWEDSYHTRFILHSTLSAINYKGVETILDTAFLLKKDNLIDFEWQVAGLNGNEELIQIIERTYGKKFLNASIKFLGNLNPTSLIKSLIGADCYIHPSHIENSPNSICESMLLGVPVIATFAGGTSSLITSGVEGILIQDGDPYSLAGAILELINDHDLKMRFSTNSARKARERHDKSKVLKDLVNIYNTILFDQL